ncbi:MAG: hypothetical protein AAF618_00050 [Pseudomonadota bacterium]
MADATLTIGNLKLEGLAAVAFFLIAFGIPWVFGLSLLMREVWRDTASFIRWLRR